MKISPKKKFFLYSFLLILIIGFLYWVFNDYGLIKYAAIGNQVDSLKHQLSQVQLENEQLKNEIDSLRKKIPAKIEKVAREKYGMKKENEVRIEVDEKEPDEEQ